MPIYEYECKSCGIFTVLRPLDERNSPACCPACQTDAKRVIHSAPGTTWLGKQTVTMHEVNERSRHEPKTLEQYKSSVHGARRQLLLYQNKNPRQHPKKPLKQVVHAPG